MARAKRKVRSETRVVRAMASVMRRDFESGVAGSLFAYEGVFIAELRASLCLACWPWDMADRAARGMVSEALRQARAVRPAWHEGQRGYAQTEITRDTVCRECGVGLRARQVSFCSKVCHDRWWRAFNREAA